MIEHVLKHNHWYGPEPLEKYFIFVDYNNYVEYTINYCKRHEIYIYIYI